MFAGRLIDDPNPTLGRAETIQGKTARGGLEIETNIVKLSSNPSTVGRRQDWESSGAPAWCSDLIKNQRPSNAVPGTPQEKITCARRTAVGDCYDGTPIRFFSQHHQDAYLYVHHFQYLKRPGVYMDVATNEPIQISNTFFFDRCLGWEGICVEANPRYFGPITLQRSCLLIPTCLAESVMSVSFRMSGAVGGIEETVKTKRKPEDNNMRIQCIRGQDIIARTGVRTIDYLSLDVEGHEMGVLHGFNWNEIVFNVITAETRPRSAVSEFLLARGYRIHEPVNAKPSDRNQIIFGSDTIYLHDSVVWGKPQ
jgi:FkbM family methyltransferase